VGWIGLWILGHLASWAAWAGLSHNLRGVAFSPDGKMLAICDDNGNVYVRVTSELAS
jgi:hypothetical protein